MCRHACQWKGTAAAVEHHGMHRGDECSLTTYPVQEASENECDGAIPLAGAFRGIRQGVKSPLPQDTHAISGQDADWENHG